MQTLKDLPNQYVSDKALVSAAGGANLSGPFALTIAAFGKSMPDPTPCLALLGRILLAGLFLGGFAQKLGDPAPAQALLAARGWPLWLIWPAALYNLAAGGAVMFGVLTRPVAATLALYCMVTSLFHFLPGDPWQMTIFVKNWAIAGGCLMLAAHGAGPWRLRWGPDRLG